MCYNWVQNEVRHRYREAVADARRTRVCWNNQLTKLCAVDSQRILTITFIFRCFLFEVFYEQSCVAASGLTRLRQLVKELHCPGVHFEMWHRLVSKHWAEPAVDLSNVTKANDKQYIRWHSFKSLLKSSYEEQHWVLPCRSFHTCCIEKNKKLRKKRR